MSISSRFRYWLAARDEHALHSPFLYDLYTRTIQADNRHLPIFELIEAHRQVLKNSEEILQVTDFGTGSGQYSRSVRSIARRSLKSAKYGRLLYRLAERFEAKTVLDLGTSLGITTAYLAKAAELSGGRVITMEGCPQTAEVARQTFGRLQCQNVQQVIGNIDVKLSQTLAEQAAIDLVFFDANHRYESTLHYFTHCLDHIHNDSVFIFDDIYWSSEMEQVWDAIRGNPAVTVSVDLFEVGLVFFRREQPKQHFVLRF